MFSLTGIVSYLHAPSAVVRDPRGAGDHVITDHGAADRFAELDLRLVLAELAAADQDGAAFDLQGVPAFAVVIPLDEGAVTEADGALAGDSGDLVARTPEGAVDETDAAGVGGRYGDHRRVRSVEGEIGRAHV